MHGVVLAMLQQVLEDDSKIKELIKKAVEESPIAKSYHVFFQYGAIGACLVVFIVLYMWGLRRQDKMHKDNMQLMQANAAQSIRNAELIVEAHQKNGDKMEKLLERYHNDLAETNTTLSMLAEKLPKGGDK